jgi:predicted nucleotidyltransferase
MDFVSHDIGKFLRLVLKANGYVLEQLLSPLVVASSRWHEELCVLASRLITRRLYYHYRGFFANQEKIYNNVGGKRVKGLLYQYRVALTGIHVLETGVIEANLPRLNDRFRFRNIDELIALKVNGEAAFLQDDGRYLNEIKELEPRLNAAYEASRLPDEVTTDTREAVKDILVRCRRALGL